MSDAGVTANLKGSWHILTLDRHFQGCDAQRLGKIADGVAVYPNENNNRLRILELKPKVDDYPDAAKKLHKTSPCYKDDCRKAFVGSELNLSFT